MPLFHLNHLDRFGMNQLAVKEFIGKIAFLISPMGLPLAAIWLLGKVQSLKFVIQDWVYG